MNKKTDINGIIKAMGLVFGDIGTSPIYTLTVLFLTTKATFFNVTGIISLIIWTLLLVVTVQYAWLAMSFSKRGEGGTIVLFEILRKHLKSTRATVFFAFLTYIGISLLIGDSVITPAISILSAVEGIKFIHNISPTQIIVITIAITILLFFVQKKGTEKISNVFGPVMLIWFFALGSFGFISILKEPSILCALNPIVGLKFLFKDGLASFFILSEVILCATGAEALYADMGHLGRKPITYAWVFACVMLLLNYLGQGVFLVNNPLTENVLFSMVYSEQSLLYIPFLLISILATIIASQGMISGLFSIVYQGINTKILPLFKIKYTSETINSQIYIGAANWFLLLFVIVIILTFKQSHHLAAAYGLAVTGTITITAIMMSTIFFIKKKFGHLFLSILLLFIDLCFLISTCTKIPNGAYWSLIIALIPLVIIFLYTAGSKKLYKSIIFKDKNDFLKNYNNLYKSASKIKGTALFFARGIEKLPPYISQTMFTNNILYEENIFVQIIKTGEAYGLDSVITDIAPGLKTLKIYKGYMQKVKIEKLLKGLDIKEKAIFYGIEDIETNNPIWQLYIILKKITPSFVSFYDLPANKIHGVVSKIILK